MDLSSILDEIDRQIAQLQQAKALLTDSSAPRKVGRHAKAVAAKTVLSRRKPLSAEAKARIAAAQKKRWAKVMKAAKVGAKKTAPAPVKKTPGKKAAALVKGVAVKTA
jgi:hypothetical protein